MYYGVDGNFQKNRGLLKRFRISFSLIALITALFLMSSGCGWNVSEDSDSNSLQGVVTDLNGNPLAGARVTIAGQEADSLTDTSGKWQIANMEATASSDSPATAALPGFQTFVGDLNQLENAPARLPEYDVAQQSEFIRVETPAEGSTLYMIDICAEPTVHVEGYLGGPYDVVFLLDISASMNEAIPWFFGITPMDIMKEALTELLEQFDFGDVRVGVIGMYGGASIIAPLTSEPAEVADAILNLEVREDGATNFERGIKTAVDLLETTGRPGGEQMVILISDGVPTAHGYPYTEEGDLLTQQQEDIDGALDAAFYAQDYDVQVHGIAIGDLASINKLTTLPTISDITGGYYLGLPDFFDTMQLPSYLTTHGIDLLEVMDQMGNVHEIPVEADGAFSADIPVEIGVNSLSFTAYKGEEPNQNVYATREHTFTVSTSEGQDGQIECHYEAGECQSTVWYLYVEYDGPTDADIDIYWGSKETYVKSVTLTENNRRIAVQESEVGKPIVPYITYRIDWDQDGVYDEETQINTTCSNSQPIGVGFTFGSLQLLGYGHGPKQEYFEGLFPY